MLHRALTTYPPLFANVLCGGWCVMSYVSKVCEYLQGGSLLDHLRTREGRSATLQTPVKFMRDIASGMAFMERGHWVHGDLAARNLLLGTKDLNLVKICDFGHAVQPNDLDELVHTDQLLPVKWTPPRTGVETPYDGAPLGNNNKKKRQCC